MCCFLLINYASLCILNNRPRLHDSFRVKVFFAADLTNPKVTVPVWERVVQMIVLHIIFAYPECFAHSSWSVKDLYTRCNSEAKNLFPNPNQIKITNYDIFYGYLSDKIMSLWLFNLYKDTCMQEPKEVGLGAKMWHLMDPLHAGPSAGTLRMAQRLEGVVVSTGLWRSAMVQNCLDVGF